MGYIEFVNKILKPSTREKRESGVDGVQQGNSLYQATVTEHENRNGETGYQSVILRNGKLWEEEVNGFKMIDSKTAAWERASARRRSIRYQPWIRRNKKDAIREADRRLSKVMGEGWQLK